MEYTDIPLLTNGLNEIELSLTGIREKAGPIKWTNRYDCPTDYEFNNEGWIETLIPYPKVSVVSPEFLSDKHYTPLAFLLQNLLAMRFLNNKPHELLLQVLIYKFKKHGYFYTEENLEWVREQSLAINTVKDFPPMDRSILRWDTLWSSTLGRAQVNRRKNFNHISDIREYMEISTKYITREVKNTAKTTLYVVKEYWKEMGWSIEDRSRKTILEALEAHENASAKELSAVTGLSINTVYKYLPK